jgi:ABC-type polar amino acid transport system ATPase subunit
MEDGVIACEGPARELLTRPSHERLRSFLSRLDIH